MTKNIAAIFMVIMVLAQIVGAQHSAVHFTDGGHYELSHSDHDDNTGGDDTDDTRDVSEACDICVMTKALSFGLMADVTTLAFNKRFDQARFNYFSHTVSNRKFTLYSACAPPVFLV